MPERLGRYEIVERLSAGGMGEVFVARFAGPGGFMKPVALKRIHPHLGEDQQFINMLHDEANVAAAVKHPNIVSTIDVGFEDGNHFVVLDFVSGDPLSRLVREMKKKSLTVPPWVVAWIGAETAAALHAAHEAKNLQGEPLDIVHRDVSLQNIMLSDAGHPMLFDFGVAKAKQRIVQTSHGELKGKLAYMAPETFRGTPVDRTVDVFSLGVVLYELLTNVSPFQRQSDLDTITALASGPIVPPSQVGGHPQAPEQLQPIDARLDAIVLTAMSRTRAGRYPTAAHVERTLREWARSAGVPHEAGAVATWLAATVPDRIASRRALLARVADPTRTYRSAAGSSSGRVMPVTPPSGGWGLTPGAGYGPQTGPGLQPGTDPQAVITGPGTPFSTDPRAGITGPGQAPHAGTDPRFSQPGSVAGVATMTGAPPPTNKGRVVGVAAVGVLVGGAIVYFVAAGIRGSPPAMPAGPAATVATTVEAPVAKQPDAPTPAPPPASAPSATATAPVTSPSVHAAPVHAGGGRGVRPTAAAAGDTGKGRGPIKRDYE